MKRSAVIALAVWGALTLPAPRAVSAAANALDNTLYAELLRRYVEDEAVDYKAMQRERSKLDRYLKGFEATDPSKLGRDDRFAFYINAYNAYTLKLVLDHYPVESIKDIGGWLKSPWKIEFCNIGGELLTLDDIEHDILRPRFKDARVHFAVNCASKGCPPLRPEPYEGSRLDEQLDDATRSFLNDPRNTRLEGDILWVSKIFSWFGEDFDNDPADFVLRHAQGDLKTKLKERKGSVRVKYLDYDWSLNDR